MAPNLTLIHNPEAGFENYSKDALLKILEKQGFQAQYCNYKTEDYAAALQDPGALVAIAGGDGTILKVSNQLINKGIPMALLPLGTANNIAGSLGINGKPEELITSWDLSKRKPLDVGVLQRADNKTYFLESAGFGLLPRLATEHSKDNTQTSSREEELAAARRHLRDLLQGHQADNCSLMLDGKEQSGKYVLVQIMNTGYAGPGLPLSPAANPGDGWLDVVLVREEERSRLFALLDSLSAETPPNDYLPVQKAKRITVTWHGRHLHDGIDAYLKTPPTQVTISLIPKGLEVLTV